MADLTKEELRQVLINAGETPVPGWTKIELKHRIMEKTGLDMTRNLKTKQKSESPCQQLIKELNRASNKKKADVLEFCSQKLGMTELSNKTVAQLQMEAMKRIMAITAAHPDDKVGFGKHSDRSYSEIQNVYVDYANWIKQTYAENKDGCDPKLRRLAVRLEAQDQEEMMSPPTPLEKFRGYMKTPPKSPGPTSSSSSTSDPHAVLMTEMLGALRDLRLLEAGARAEEDHEDGGQRSRDRWLLHQSEGATVEMMDDEAEPSSSSITASDLATHQSDRPLSASEQLSRQLSLGRARRLEEQAWGIVPDLFHGLVAEKRTVLMEVCCSPESLLTSTIQAKTGCLASATRCSKWNCGDLGSGPGLKLALQRLEMENPPHVWLSPPCGPYSPLQNVNSRNPEQRAQLEEKRAEAMRIYVGCCVLIHVCVQKGVHVTLELSERCQAWRTPLLQNLQNKYSLYSAITRGCRVGLRGKRDGQLLRKGWRIVTSCKRLAEELDLPCRCSRNYQHGKCEGQAAKDSELYTPEFTRRASKVILQKLDHMSLLSEVQGQSPLPSQFGEGPRRMCSEVSLPKRKQLCGHCLLRSDVVTQGSDNDEGKGSGIAGCWMEGDGLGDTGLLHNRKQRAVMFQRDSNSTNLHPRSRAASKNHVPESTICPHTVRTTHGNPSPQVS